MSIFKKIFFCLLINLFFSVNVKADNFDITKYKNKKKAKAIKKFCSSHAKIVWVDCQKGVTNDTFLTKSENILMGINTKDNKGIIPLINKKFPLKKPMISPRGDSVFFTNFKTLETYFTKWGSGKIEKFSDGIMLGFYYDKTNNKEWVYIGKNAQKQAFGIISTNLVEKINKNNKSEKHKVWDNSVVSLDNFSISKNGEQFSSAMPWPLIGFGNFKQKDWSLITRGCWPNMIPSKYNIISVFDGAHKKLKFYSVNPPKEWKINLNTHPALKSHEVYHPKWGNHPKYVVLSGPYKKTRNSTALYTSGNTADIFISKFSENLSKTSDWMRITKNNYGEFFPDIWIENGSKEELNIEKVSANKRDFLALISSNKEKWPIKNQDNSPIAYWINLQSNNKIISDNNDGPFILDFKEKARPNKVFEAICDGGYLKIRDTDAKNIINKIKANNEFALEFALNSTTRNQGVNNDTTIFQIADFKSNNEILSLITVKQKDISIVSSIAYGSDTKNIADEKYNLHSFGFLTPSSTNQLVISIKNNEIRFYLDGTRKKTAKLNDNIKAILSNAENPKIIFGSEFNKNINQINSNKVINEWKGKISHIAFHEKAIFDLNTILASKMVLTNKINNIKKIPPLIMEAEVVVAPPIPDKNAINEYSRSLSIITYKFKKLISGKLPKDLDIFAAAQWSILDRKILPSILSKKLGSIHTLKLDSFYDHPEIDSERWDNDISDVDDDGKPDGENGKLSLDEILYFDVSEL